MCMHILLVESDPHDIESVRGGFAAMGTQIAIEVVRTGEEGVDLLLGVGAHAGRAPASTPQLVLLSIGLPGMDGFDVLRRIRAHPRTRRTPVVLLSDSPDVEHIARGYELGANSVIVKPRMYGDSGAASRTLGTYWTRYNVLPEW
jgi:two-component system response regulator